MQGRRSAETTGSLVQQASTPPGGSGAVHEGIGMGQVANFNLSQPFYQTTTYRPTFSPCVGCLLGKNGRSVGSLLSEYHPGHERRHEK
jgi:hypothetical protein